MPRDLRIEQVGVGRFLRSVEQLLPIDDLHDARATSAVTEVDAIAFRTERDWSMQLGRYRHHRRPGLLAGKAEVADESRVGWIAQVVDLRHPPGAPFLRPRDDVGDAGVALPEVLVRVDEAIDQHQDTATASRDR